MGIASREGLSRNAMVRQHAVGDVRADEFLHMAACAVSIFRMVLLRKDRLVVTIKTLHPVVLSLRFFCGGDVRIVTAYARHLPTANNFAGALPQGLEVTYRFRSFF